MKRNAFTIFEVLLSTIVIGFIAMLLTSSLISSRSNETLQVALDKNTTFLQQVYQSIPMLQLQGQLAPGVVDANTLMRAIVLTSKCIDLAPNGAVITGDKSKFGTYIYDANLIPNIMAQTNVDKYSSYVLNSKNNTIILHNNVIISINKDKNIVVDVNGRKLPNVLGGDIFIFTINNNRLELVPQP